MDKNKKNKILFVTFLATFFILGWFLNSISLNIHEEKPFLGSEERLSPSDRVKEEHLQLFSDKLIINFPELRLASYTNTNSMDPLFDEHATGLEIMPSSEEDIHAGDIIAYQSGNDLIVHRVILIGEDGLGWYAVLKGDNSKELEKVRFEQVKYLLIGILY